MEKTNFNLDAHSSLIIADGSIVEINGQKVLLTLVKDGDKPEPKVIDLHKDSWGVYNDGSQRFKDTVIKWLNDRREHKLNGHSEVYYGRDIYGSWDLWSNKSYFTHILTLDEFCALAYPETSEAGSELVGKFLRYKREGFDITNKWFEIKSVKPAFGMYEDSTYALAIDSDKAPYGDKCFDLSNALDYNPETLIGKYWNGAKITGIYINENDNNPYFSLESTVVNSIKCSKVTPSDVTDTPPIPSLKYEDCFERVKPKWTADSDLNAFESTRYYKTSLPTERQAKQLAATIKLMTIAHDANGGWIPNKREMIVVPVLLRSRKDLIFVNSSSNLFSPIYFRYKETALRAYEENKEIFRDYFGINE